MGAFHSDVKATARALIHKIFHIVFAWFQREYSTVILRSELSCEQVHQSATGMQALAQTKEDLVDRARSDGAQGP